MCFGCTEKVCNNCDSGEVELDVDSDGILDLLDNCPVDSNPVQADADDDGAGDACDNCQVDSNPGQENADGDDLGDVCDDCPLDADNDADGDGICGDVDNCPNASNEDQADTDGDDMGNVCDPCPDDPDNLCTGLVLIPAAPLGVSSGCVTYEGDHPVEPGQGFVVHYEFCADGTAVKDWNPSPVESPGLPGDTHGVGNWSYVGNELNITTTATVLGSMSMVTVEEYGVAFTYDSGAKLDWYSVAQTAPGDGSTIIGSYASQGQASVTMGALLDFDADITKEMDVTDGDPASWAQTETQVKTCVGAACTPDMRGTSNIDTHGTIAMPGQLYRVDGTYFIQADDSLVLERQE